MALWLKGPERGRRVDAHTTKCTVYIGASSLDDCSAQVFPYNIFAYCSICRVDCKFARNKKKSTSKIRGGRGGNATPKLNVHMSGSPPVANPNYSVLIMK
jgi:hypothetical protein